MENVLSTILNLGYYGLSFIVVISAIVFVHEYGHYIVAKLCKVKIESFSIGFGKEIFGFNDKSGTRWKFSIIPAGGYVKMFGDANEASAPDQENLKNMPLEDKQYAFHFKKLYQKALIVAAGPIANFLLASVILSFFYMYHGKPYTPAIISNIAKDSAAYESGLEIGDKIISIDGEEVITFDQIIRTVSTNVNSTINITYQRDGITHEAELKPKLVDSKDVFGNKIQSRKLGISSNITHYEHLPAISAISASIIEIKHIITSTCKVLSQMITGKRNLDDLGGPIRVIKYSGQSMDKGVLFTLWFIAMLSVNIGFVNLLPIPVLDGGHLFFYLIEACTNTTIAMRIQHYSMKAGIVLIFALIAFTTFNDLKMLFQS